MLVGLTSYILAILFALPSARRVSALFL
jgi:hypothetical protein